MWSMDVYSKAWLSLWRAGSNPSPREEGSSLRSGSRRLRPLPHGMGSISHRSTTPMDQWRTDFIARRKAGEDELHGRGQRSWHLGWFVSARSPSPILFAFVEWQASLDLE